MTASPGVLAGLRDQSWISGWFVRQDGEVNEDGSQPGMNPCSCFNQYTGFDQDWDGPDSEVRFHAERQDSSAPGWLRLLELVDEAATDGRETFAPMRVLTPESGGTSSHCPRSLPDLPRSRN
jgi:hypothetical protein